MEDPGDLLGSCEGQAWIPAMGQPREREPQEGKELSTVGCVLGKWTPLGKQERTRVAGEGRRGIENQKNDEVGTVIIVHSWVCRNHYYNNLGFFGFSP